MLEYKVTVDECDVKDRANLVHYREARTRWLGWYGYDQHEPHTIQGQLFAAMFADMAHRCLRAADKNDDQPVGGNNHLIFRLLNTGYVVNQILSIRRLLDRRVDVISVPRLTNDMKKNRKMLTRENYISYDGLPYSPEDWQHHMPNHLNANSFGLQATSAVNYGVINARHRLFDGLSGTTAASRKRTDIVQESIFEKLESWLSGSPAEDLRILSDKFLAHAADGASRGDLRFSGVRLDDIAATQKAIVRVATAAANFLIPPHTASDVVPIPPLGLFQGLNTQFASAAGIEAMYSTWEELTEERNRWAVGLEADLFGMASRTA